MGTGPEGRGCREGVMLFGWINFWRWGGMCSVQERESYAWAYLVATQSNTEPKLSLG